MKKVIGLRLSVIFLVVLLCAVSVYANPYLEISPVELTVERFVQIVPWFNTEAKPRAGMGLDRVLLREVSSTHVILTLTYSDLDNGDSLDLMLFGQRENLQKDHAQEPIADWSMLNYLGFHLEPAIIGEETNVIVGLVDFPLSRSYAWIFLRDIIIR